MTRDRPFLRGLGRLVPSLSFFLVPVVFLLIVLLFFPGRSRFQFDSDEGVFLMMGMLIEKGHPLYEEVWSDHPPLLPVSLAAGFSLVGYRVGAARLFVAFLSGLLLAGAYRFLKTSLGKTEALVGLVLLFFAPGFLVLSVSVMNGLPAISLAVLSLMLLTYWHKQRRTLWLVLSGAVLALSVNTKLFTGLLAPVYFLGLFISGYLNGDPTGNLPKALGPAAIWSAGFLLPFSIILLGFAGLRNLPDLFLIHLIAPSVPEFDEAKYQLTYHVTTAHILYLVLGAAGSVQAIRRRNWVMLYPAAWLLLGIGLLVSISPVWDHHLMLVVIPAAILAAPVTEALIRRLVMAVSQAVRVNGSSQVKNAAILGILLVVVALSRPEAFEYLRLFPSEADSGLHIESQKAAVFEEIRAYAPQTEWMLTDNLMMAFRARVPVPPYTATFSLKRLLSGELSEEVLIDVVNRYDPEQVFLDRFELQVLSAALEADYRIKSEEPGDFVWYVRKDLPNP